MGNDNKNSKIQEEHDGCLIWSSNCLLFRNI